MTTVHTRQLTTIHTILPLRCKKKNNFLRYVGSYEQHVRIKWEKHVIVTNFAFADGSSITSASG
jgi:hypothetical protein